MTSSFEIIAFVFCDLFRTVFFDKLNYSHAEVFRLIVFFYIFHAFSEWNYLFFTNFILHFLLQLHKLYPLFYKSK